MFPSQADDWAKILFTDTLSPSKEIADIARQAGEPFFLAALDATLAAGDDFNGFMAQLKATSGFKGKALFMPLRAALSGRTDGPELAKLYQALEPFQMRKRLAEYAGAAG